MKRTFLASALVMLLTPSAFAAEAYFDFDTATLHLPETRASVYGNYGVQLQVVDDNPLTVELVGDVSAIEGTNNPDATLKLGCMVKTY